MVILYNSQEHILKTTVRRSKKLEAATLPFKVTLRVRCPINTPKRCSRLIFGVGTHFYYHFRLIWFKLVKAEIA